MILSRGLIVVAFFIQGCAAAILTDNRIPIDEKSEKIKEQFDYAQSVATSRTPEPVSADGIICSNSARYKAVLAGVKFPVGGTETCFFEIFVECSNESLKYRFRPVEWKLNGLSGTTQTDEDGRGVIPVKKSDQYGMLEVSAAAKTIVSEFKKGLTIQVPEAACLNSSRDLPPRSL